VNGRKIAGYRFICRGFRSIVFNCSMDIVIIKTRRFRPGFIVSYVIVRPGLRGHYEKYMKVSTWG
jgi:hypothetical protein